MTALRFILGDQLSNTIPLVQDFAKGDVILMAEVWDEATYVPHHKQKIAFLFSAMRHFAKALQDKGYLVDYIALDDPDNTGSLAGELRRAVSRHKPHQVIMMEPGEWRVLELMQHWRTAFEIPLTILPDKRFIASKDEFSVWAQGRKSLRMEFFYRDMRRKTGLLMNGDEPEGGQWNFDQDNRKALPKTLKPPPRLRFEPDLTTRNVLALVGERFSHHFGDLEPFGWPVTRDDALKALDHFITYALPHFGDYQDAMKQGEPFLFHSLISPCLNAGLLQALEICEKVEVAYQQGRAPLNAAEGFVRQILGWREYVRGFYWHFMPDYPKTNALNAERPLPWFYWSGETAMNCLKQSVEDTRQHAYAHHIQRLMVLGNFALLIGVIPQALEEWFLAVYADAYEWVELPNVHGMALFADDGILASKPYIASGAYINRMSDYCGSCKYNVTLKEGEKACPFNYLYWDFLARHEAKFKTNPRLAMPYPTLNKMSLDKRNTIAKDAKEFMAKM
jgi:deoxyribodipyrimidine photolyase-related protein